MKTDRLLGPFAYIHYICQLVPNRNNRPTEFTNRIESRWPFERGVMRFANRPPCRSLKLLFQKLGVCSPFFPSSLDNPPARYVATESTNEEPTTGVHNIQLVYSLYARNICMQIFQSNSVQLLFRLYFLGFRLHWNFVCG